MTACKRKQNPLFERERKGETALEVSVSAVPVKSETFYSDFKLVVLFCKIWFYRFLTLRHIQKHLIHLVPKSFGGLGHMQPAEV